MPDDDLASNAPTYAPSERDHSYGRFASEQPGYLAGGPVEALRDREYARLDALGDVYLDYTGGGLYAQSQVTRHHALLSGGVFGNPHSHNPTSLAATELVEKARAAVHTFFSADPAVYDVVFTANASGALKLVGESYPFDESGRFTLTYDNHNSVNGIREYARARGAAVTYLPVTDPDLRLDDAAVSTALAAADPAQANLFAYPAQSNFSGAQHPLAWIDEAHDAGWHVLLDSAAYAPTNVLDLSRVQPDFVPLSFYKMFGYPTGIGALIARKEALATLRRPWFAGGTITLASVQGEGWHHLAPGSTGFEDGTVDYLGLPAVTIGLEHLASVGMASIHDRVCALGGWLLGEMLSLSHSNGAPMVRFFGPRDMERRGATFAFYLLDPEGTPYDVYRVEQLAGEERISVRTGCFCNPGDGETAHHITRDDMQKCFTDVAPVTFETCNALILDTTGKMANTVRVSLGIASTFDDVYRFMAFAAAFRDRSAGEVERGGVRPAGLQREGGA